MIDKQVTIKAYSAYNTKLLTDSIIQRLASGLVPDNGSLPLVCNPNSLDIIRRYGQTPDQGNDNK